MGIPTRNRQRGTGKLSACVSDVLMTLRNTEQANQYGRRCVCTRCTIAFSPSVIASVDCRLLPREVPAYSKGIKRLTFINRRLVTHASLSERDFLLSWFVCSTRWFMKFCLDPYFPLTLFPPCDKSRFFSFGTGRCFRLSLMHLKFVEILYKFCSAIFMEIPACTELAILCDNL